MTCDSELLVGYLYDEVSAADRQRLERHLAACPGCRAEVDGLSETRETLRAWTPPAADLGFEVIRRPVEIGRRRPAFHVPRRLGLAAAAVLVLALASALANLDVRLASDGVSIRTGWNHAAAPPTQRDAGVAAATPSHAESTPTAADFAALTVRLRELEAAVASRPPASATESTVSVSRVELLRQVRQLIAESEKRQQGELALMIGQVHRDVDAARRADFARLQQGLAQVQGLNDAQVLWQRQVEDRLLRAVQQQR
ncbi:MAG TPA: zf-HC2 domain-containing protein [Vicinamibacterales bacterium]|nr:zf-HC2 domain-containing protein [Vicinamibacterales bacterium]